MTNHAPFLGQIRAVHYAYMLPLDGRRTTAPLEAMAAIRLEQWNGTEWVLVWDFQPCP
jgi:hypothetical protein